jgi:GT2 family glycosyltransferase
VCLVTIIVPVYNAIESARDCLAAIYSVSTLVPFEVIVVDNGSSPEVSEWLVSETRRRERLTVLHFNSPLGFARAVNEGARKAQHEFIGVLNSDTVVTDGWLDRLLDAMRTDPNIGIVSPVTDHSGPGSQLVAAPPHLGVRLTLIEEPCRLFFFCVIIRRQLWEKLGGLDEVYKVGTYEDDDFCLRARIAGWSMAVVPDVFVFNGASKTFHDNGIDRDEWIFRNETVFLERASRLSRSPSSASSPRPKKELHQVSVLIAVLSGAGGKLADSLYSLANQTVSGFEVVIAAHHAQALPELPAELVQSLRIRRVAVIDDEQAGLGSLWNAALESARGYFLAYLPAGDIYFPYHLEILDRALKADGRQAVCSGWSVAIHGEVDVKRAPGRNGGIGAWTPMVSWMHTRGCRPEWEFTSTEVWFEPAITCERNRWIEDRSGEGKEEEVLIVRRHEQEHRGRRVRRLLNRHATAQIESAPIREASRRLSAVTASRKASSAVSGRVDFIFFNILGWTDLTQRPHHFATGLSRRGHRVFWIDVQLIPPESFDGTLIVRELKANIFEVRLPGPGGAIYHQPWTLASLDLMAGAMAQVRDVNGIGRAVQFVNFPRWRPLAQRLREDFGWPVLYDCLDDQYAFGELYRQNVSEDEGELTRICDALVTSGHVLFETKRKQRPDVILIPNAVDYKLFRASAASGLPDCLNHPIIGFFGAFGDWLDFDWVAAAAREFPSWTFVYIGREGFSCEETRERWRAATSHPNVHLLPQTDLPKLAACLRDFHVCTMPFQDLPITRSMHAVKIYEYLAAGKHIVVPALPEMLPFAEQGLLFSYRSHRQSFELLEELVARPPAPEEIFARSSFAARNDWSERLDRFLDAIHLHGFIEPADAPESGA